MNVYISKINKHRKATSDCIITAQAIPNHKPPIHHTRSKYPFTSLEKHEYSHLLSNNKQKHTNSLKLKNVTTVINQTKKMIIARKEKSSATQGNCSQKKYKSMHRSSSYDKYFLTKPREKMFNHLIHTSRNCNRMNVKYFKRKKEGENNDSQSLVQSQSQCPSQSQSQAQGVQITQVQITPLHNSNSTQFQTPLTVNHLYSNVAIKYNQPQAQGQAQIHGQVQVQAHLPSSNQKSVTFNSLAQKKPLEIKINPKPSFPIEEQKCKRRTNSNSMEEVPNSHINPSTSPYITLSKMNGVSLKYYPHDHNPSPSVTSSVHIPSSKPLLDSSLKHPKKQIKIYHTKISDKFRGTKKHIAPILTLPPQLSNSTSFKETYKDKKHNVTEMNQPLSMRQVPEGKEEKDMKDDTIDEDELNEKLKKDKEKDREVMMCDGNFNTKEIDEDAEKVRGVYLPMQLQSKNKVELESERLEQHQYRPEIMLTKSHVITQSGMDIGSVNCSNSKRETSSISVTYQDIIRNNIKYSKQNHHKQIQAQQKKEKEKEKQWSEGIDYNDHHDISNSNSNQHNCIKRFAEGNDINKTPQSHKFMQIYSSDRSNNNMPYAYSNNNTNAKPGMTMNKTPIKQISPIDDNDDDNDIISHDIIDNENITLNEPINEIPEESTAFQSNPSSNNNNLQKFNTFSQPHLPHHQSNQPHIRRYSNNSTENENENIEIDTECLFEGEEKSEKETKKSIPVFSSVKLLNTKFPTLSKHHLLLFAPNQIPSIKSLPSLLLNHRLLLALLPYLSYQSLSILCKSTKSLRNTLKQYLYSSINQSIFTEDKQSFTIRQRIKKSLWSYSKLSKDLQFLQKTYFDYLYKRSQYDEDIQKDLTRTFPDDQSFKPGNRNFMKLYHLLTAYANYNKKIGYAQGLNFLVANSLHLFEREEEVFIFIDGLINRFHLEQLYGVTNDLKDHIDVIGFLLHKHTPKVMKYLDQIFLGHEFFSANWVLTIFANSMRHDKLFFIWDFMIVFGKKFFNYFIVAVISRFAKNIIGAEQSCLSQLMKGLLKSEVFEREFKGIVRNTFELMQLYCI